MNESGWKTRRVLLTVSRWIVGFHAVQLTIVTVLGAYMWLFGSEQLDDTHFLRFLTLAVAGFTVVLNTLFVGLFPRRGDPSIRLASLQTAIPLVCIAVVGGGFFFALAMYYGSKSGGPTRMDERSHGLVHGGRKRAIAGLRQQLRAELAEEYRDRLAAAGFTARLVLRREMRRELKRRVRLQEPSRGTLYVR